MHLKKGIIYLCNQVSLARLGAGFGSALADIFEMPANDWLTGRGHPAFDREHVDPYLRRKENKHERNIKGT